jgi:hypothetical protein
MGAEMKHPESDAPLAGRAGSLVTRRVRGSHRCRWKFQAGGAGCAGRCPARVRAPRDAADGVDDADIEPDRIDDPLAADDDGLDEDPTGH